MKDAQLLCDSKLEYAANQIFHEKCKLFFFEKEKKNETKQTESIQKRRNKRKNDGGRDRKEKGLKYEQRASEKKTKTKT